MSIKLTILGCGTSTGVPVIGCHCGVCASSSPYNKRTRSSVLITDRDKNILIDTSTDLRAQSLRHGIERIDAVLFTHPHADHIHGIDELRAFNLAQNSSIPCYGNAATIERIRRVFDYIFTDNANDGWKPSLTTTVVDGPFEIGPTKISPVEICHGRSGILGYRFGKLAYLTDCSSIPDESVEKLRGVQVLVLGALRHKPHPTHFSIDEAIEASGKIGPERTVFTHLSHNIDFERDSRALPGGVEFAFDGLTIEIS